MPKKNKQEDLAEGEELVLSGVLVGGVLAALGCLCYYLGGKYIYINGFDWVQMGGILLVAVGAMVFLSGGVTWSGALEWLRSFGYAIALALLIRWPIAEPYRIPSNSMFPTLYGEEGLGKGDRVFVNKWIYGVRWPFLNKRLWYGQAPERYDIVVFKAVEENAQHPTLVKRIVGMPGERIHVDGATGVVYRFFKPGDPVPSPEESPDLDWTRAREGAPRGVDEVWTFVPLITPEFLPESLREQGPLRRDAGMLYGVDFADEYSRIPDGHYLLLGDNRNNSRDGRYYGWVPNEHLVGRVACIWWPPKSWRDFTGFSDTWWWRTFLAVSGTLLAVRLLIGRSVAVRTRNGRGVDHVFAEFLSLGLRIPFTPWWVVRWGRPRHGDLVLYSARAGEQAPELLLTGRVAALPGDRAIFENDRLLVNDAPPPHRALAETDFPNRKEDGPHGRSRSKQHTQAPDGHYFILASEEDQETAVDSRRVGWVDGKKIIARARVVWWPPTRWRRL